MASDQLSSYVTHLEENPLPGQMTPIDIHSGSLQLHRCDNPWKPNMNSRPNGHSEVYGRMLGILNRITEHSMYILLEQALELPITNPEHLPGILNLFLTKSQDEPLFASTYAHLCFELAQRIDIQESLRAACEVHFRDSLNRLLEYDRIFQGPITSELIQQEIVARKRLTVHIGFVCELERKQIVPTDQIVNMTKILLSNDDIRSVECLCRLLSYCGSRLTYFQKELVDDVCTTLQNLLSIVTLSPRLRFLVLETLELRANGWHPRIPPNSAISGRNVRG